MESIKMTAKDEVYDLIYEAQQGSIETRNYLITKNQGLVYYVIYKKFYNTSYDLDDLIQIGNIGLIKAINTFDVSKNVKFSTYATKCIKTEILLFFRKQERHDKIESVENNICQDINGKDISLFNFLPSDTNLEEDYIKEELYTNLRKIIEGLKEEERNLIILFYGLYGNRRHSQKELSMIFNISQPAICRKIKKIIKKIRIKLDKLELIEVSKKDEKLYSDKRISFNKKEI